MIRIEHRHCVTVVRVIGWTIFAAALILIASGCRIEGQVALQQTDQAKKYPRVHSLPEYKTRPHEPVIKLSRVRRIMEKQARRQRFLVMLTTAYCSEVVDYTAGGTPIHCPTCINQAEFADGVTASGHKIQPGDRFLAADKRWPFGTVMRVPGYNGGKPSVVHDRGGAIKGNRLDLYFPTHQEALEWGVKPVLVEVVR